MPFSHRRMMLPAKRRMPTSCLSPAASGLCMACTCGAGRQQACQPHPAGCWHQHALLAQGKPVRSMLRGAAVPAGHGAVCYCSSRQQVSWLRADTASRPGADGIHSLLLDQVQMGSIHGLCSRLLARRAGQQTVPKRSCGCRSDAVTRWSGLHQLTPASQIRAMQCTLVRHKQWLHALESGSCRFGVLQTHEICGDEAQRHPGQDDLLLHRVQQVPQ